MNNFRTLVSALVVENKKYVVVEIKTENGNQYGTISYDLLDNEGRLIRPVNGLEMLLENTMDRAIKTRQLDTKTDRLIKEYMTENKCSFDVAIMEVYKNL